MKALEEVICSISSFILTPSDQWIVLYLRARKLFSDEEKGMTRMVILIRLPLRIMDDFKGEKAKKRKPGI